MAMSPTSYTHVHVPLSGAAWVSLGLVWKIMYGDCYIIYFRADVLIIAG